jgi:hypothetical protein
MSVLPDSAYALLTTAFMMCSKLKHLRARAYYLLGRNARLISELMHQTRKTNLNDPKNSELSLHSFITKWGPKVAEIQKRLQSDMEQNKSKTKSVTSKSFDMSSQVTIAGASSTNGQIDASFANRPPQFASEQLEAIYSQKEFFVEEENTVNLAKLEAVKVGIHLLINTF